MHACTILRGCCNTDNCSSCLNHAMIKHLSVSTVIGDQLLPAYLWPSRRPANSLLAISKRSVADLRH